MIRSADYLKGQFITGKVPTSAAFSDLIDSVKTTIVQTLSSALVNTGFILVEPGYNFEIQGGDAFLEFLEAEVTASVVSMFSEQQVNVFVSSDFVIDGSGGVVTTGDFEDGIKISLDVFGSPTWISAGNRITIDSRGRITNSSAAYTDFGVTYFTTVEGSKNVYTIIHPNIASARQVAIHCSAIRSNADSTQLIKFVQSTAATDAGPYTTGYISLVDEASALSYQTRTALQIHGSAALDAGQYYWIDSTFYPMPRTMGGIFEYIISSQSTNTGAIGSGTMQVNADTTIKGIQFKLGDAKTYTTSGHIRIAIT